MRVRIRAHPSDVRSMCVCTPAGTSSVRRTYTYADVCARIMHARIMHGRTRKKPTEKIPPMGVSSPEKIPPMGVFLGWLRQKNTPYGGIRAKYFLISSKKYPLLDQKSQKLELEELKIEDFQGFLDVWASWNWISNFNFMMCYRQKRQEFLKNRLKN